MTVTSESLRIIPRPEFAPGCCALSLRSEDPLGFVDTMLTPAFVDPRIQVGVSTIKEYAEKLGYYNPGAADRIVELEAKLAELEADLDRHRRETENVTREIESIYILKSAGWRPAGKPGRPRKNPLPSETD